jgi:hypothetical protein
MTLHALARTLHAKFAALATPFFAVSVYFVSVFSNFSERSRPIAGSDQVPSISGMVALG